MLLDFKVGHQKLDMRVAAVVVVSSTSLDVVDVDAVGVVVVVVVVVAVVVVVGGAVVGGGDAVALGVVSFRFVSFGLL